MEQGGRVAFILVDALRFEMAQGFALDLKREKYNVSLSARLAELPTDTVIGMNALAPVERNGRLRLVMSKGSFAGFATGEFTVSDPASRVRVMSQRSVSGMAEDIKLEDFQDLSLTQLKRRLSGKPALVVVRSRDLDAAGEHGFHLGTFEQTLALLKSALSIVPGWYRAFRHRLGSWVFASGFDDGECPVWCQYACARTASRAVATAIGNVGCARIAPVCPGLRR